MQCHVKRGLPERLKSATSVGSDKHMQMLKDHSKRRSARSTGREPSQARRLSSFNMSSSASEPIVPIVVALPPWKLKGTIYSFMFYVTAKDAAALQDRKSFLYSPLEANSVFSDGTLIGGLASVQVIRYTESPVGPYDEIIIVPGKFEYEIETKGGNGEVKRETKRNLRVTRIYVSQEKTCWNGRNSKICLLRME